MRIAHFLRTTSATYGGPPACAINLASALARRGHELWFMTADDQGLPSARRASVGTVVKFDPWLSQRGPLVGKELARVEATIAGMEFVHLHEVWELANWQVARMCERHSIPFCITAHGSLAPWALRKSALRKRIAALGPAGRMLRNAAFVHFTAESERDYSHRATGNPRTLVAPNIIDMAPYRELHGPEAARQALGMDASDPMLLFMSRICPGKGLEHVIRAMPTVLRRFPAAILAVAGSGDPRWIDQMKAEVGRLGIERSVRFLGFVSGPLKASMLQACDLFVLPSDHENFGNALFEAAACGARLLISEGVATWRELVDAGAARVIERTPRAIADSVEAELSVPRAERLLTSSRIRAWTLGYFEGPGIVGRYEDAYIAARAASVSESG